MNESLQTKLERLFRRIIAWRWPILAVYAVLLPLGILYALKVPQDNSLDRLVVQSDEDYKSAKEFEKVFGSGEYILLMAEAPDPFAPEVLARVWEIEERLRAIPGVESSSALSIFAKANGGFTSTPESAGAFRKFATGTDLFGSQGLVVKDVLAIPVVIRTDVEAPSTIELSTARSSSPGSPGPETLAPHPGSPDSTEMATTSSQPPDEDDRASKGGSESRDSQIGDEGKAQTAHSSKAVAPGPRSSAVDPKAQRIREKLEAIDKAVDDVARHPAPLSALRKIGGPYVDRYLDEATSRATLRFMPLFGLLILALNLAIYRSLRTLLAFIVTLGTCVAVTMGYIGATGGVISIVSPLVPMTILITSTANLVYVHSRFVHRPAGTSVDEHQVFALANKFVACTASIFATAVGFAALAVSKIRPIREMGLWVGVGLLITWVVVFTLFPALQKILRTPTREEDLAVTADPRRAPDSKNPVSGAGGIPSPALGLRGRPSAEGARGVTSQAVGSPVVDPRSSGWFERLTDRLPEFSYRYRWVLVPSTLVLCAVGVVALMGIPGLLPPMRLETDELEYVNRNSPIYKDTKKLESVIKGLSITEVWLKSGVAALEEPEVLAGIDRFQRSLEPMDGVGAVAGPSTVVRMMRYVAGKGDDFPQDRAALQALGSQLERLVGAEPGLRDFFDAALSQTHIAVISNASDYESYARLQAGIERTWAEARERDPALAGFEMRITGEGPLQAKISYYLVPTLIESFGLTVVIIFGAFLIVFRNGPARLMAMIPSLFAILVMFAVMRVTGMALNVATILIASTVLGTSENDQIHFFYHFLEKRRSGSAEDGLRHTLRVAGRAIVFATLINAGGFLAFAFADLPPMRQFGILSALAFTLSMVADFTALPAALWIVFRERPESMKRSPVPARTD